MTAQQNKRRPPSLNVVFDTNALYNGSASDLLNDKVAMLIRMNSNHDDLSITWYLPEIVMHERTFQMLERGREFLPSIQKLERLLGHNLNITEEIISTRVREAIGKQIGDLCIQQFNLDTAKVDWDHMILDAAYRRPPFERGEKEKGFRDALVAETFLQIASQSPKTPRRCRVVLVTGDGRLTDAVKARTGSFKNVRIAASLEELEGLINTLVADVTEAYVQGIQEKALAYFFEEGNEQTLYYKEGIRDRIEEKFSEQLADRPRGATRRDNGMWRISTPRFVRKEGQRVYWTSQVTVEGKAYKQVQSAVATAASVDIEGYLYQPYLDPNVISLPGLAQSDMYAPGAYAPGVSPYRAGSPVAMPAYLGQLLGSRSLEFSETGVSRALVAKGRTVFEVIWSVSISTKRKNFSGPKIEDIRFVEISWE